MLGRAFAGTPLRAARQFVRSSAVSQRTERVDELLRQEIGSIVTREVADPRIGFVTVTSVETTPDLRHAKVWVSVIGQPAERDAAVAALASRDAVRPARAGQRLRLKRIPDLHVHLDDTAERGTRILRLLADIEHGIEPGAGRSDGRIPADARSTRATTRTISPRSRRRPCGHRCRRAGVTAGPAHARLVPQGNAIEASMSVDLRPYLDAVPQAVVDRLRGARRVLAVSHENPDADTLGATLGVVRLVEAMGGTADPVCTDPVPPLYEFMAGVERFRTDPDPRPRPTTCS